jgi:hypothetical protein
VKETTGKILLKVLIKYLKVLMNTAKYWENIIVLLLSQEYMKLEIQENPGWGTFISEKKKYRICLLSSSNGINCAFLTTKLERTEMQREQ